MLKFDHYLHVMTDRRKRLLLGDSDEDSDDTIHTSHSSQKPSSRPRKTPKEDTTTTTTSMAGGVDYQASDPFSGGGGCSHPIKTEDANLTSSLLNTLSPTHRNSTTIRGPASADRVQTLREYLTNPFMPELYYRSACLLMLTEIGRLQSANELDCVKLLCHM